MNNIKPCPFCGGEAKVNSVLGFYWISCGECGMEIRSFPRKKDAIAAWNKRVGEQVKGEAHDQTE